MFGSTAGVASPVVPVVVVFESEAVLVFASVDAIWGHVSDGHVAAVRPRATVGRDPTAHFVAVDDADPGIV